jgi:hypothetical protein
MVINRTGFNPNSAGFLYKMMMTTPDTSISALESQADMDYWDTVEERLASTYDFAKTLWSGQAYSMMRANDWKPLTG